MVDLLSQAINNNIHLCRAVTASFDVTCTVSNTTAVFSDKARPYYPSIITRQPTITDDDLAVIAALTKGEGVKDSFASLDLEPLGFTAIFQAQWIAREPHNPTAPPLTTITSATLPAWRLAWGADNAAGQSNFVDTLLDRPDINLFANSGITAGLITNQSEQGITGLSNIFGATDDIQTILSGLAANDTLVGYETDPDPFFALDFKPLGPLRVWIKTS